MTTDAKIVSETPDPEALPAAPWPKERTSAERAEEVMRRVKAASAGDMAAEAREFRLNFQALFDVIASLQSANTSLAQRSQQDSDEVGELKRVAEMKEKTHAEIVRDYRVKVSDLGRRADRYKRRCVGLTLAIKAGWSLKLPSEC